MQRLPLIAFATVVTAFLATAAAAQNPGQDPIARVNALMGGRRYREAEALLRPMVEKAATPELQHALGFALSAQFRFREAEPFLQSASDQRPKSDAWLHQLAACKLELGQGADAAALLDRALAINPSPEYRFARAMCALNMADSARAETELRLCVKARPDDAEAWSKLAQLLVDRGDYARAIEPARACVKVAPRHVEGRYLLGLSSARTGADADAVALSEGVLKDVPGQLGASYNLARALIRAGRAEEGRARLESFKTASVNESRLRALTADVKRNPSVLRLRLELAEALLSSGSAAAAIPHLMQARELDSFHAATYRLLARAFKGDGRHEDAARASFAAEQLEKGVR